MLQKNIWRANDTNRLDHKNFPNIRGSMLHIGKNGKKD